MADRKYYYGDDFPIDSIVYFVRHNGHHSWVDYGIVAENRTSEIYVDLLEAKMLDEKIDGVPVEEMQFPTKWKKLPKGWSCDTKLFDWDQGHFDKNAPFISIKKPDELLNAYKNGWLVKSWDVDHHLFEAEIDSHKGWRIVHKEHPYYGAGAMCGCHWPVNVTVLPYQLYKTYEEAEAVVKAEEAEFERQANLTDKEWSIELIEHDIGRWAKIYDISYLDVQRATDFLMSLDDIEDVETRICGGELQWKWFKNKRWGAVLI